MITRIMLILGFLLALIFIYDEARADGANGKPECNQIRYRIVSDINSTYFTNTNKLLHIRRAAVFQDLYFKMGCPADRLADDITNNNRRIKND